MEEKIRRRLDPGIIVAIIVVVLVAAAGIYALARSNAQSPTKPAVQAPAGLLRPLSLGTAPYQYIAYSGSLEQTRQATNIKNYFAAFIVASEGCKPSWGGTPAGELNSPRAAAILADMNALRANGGDVAISFGGSNGVELASACATTEKLTAAYKQVIDTYQVKRVDFDIEGPALDDKAGGERRAAAIANLQKEYPDLRIWVTLPVTPGGLTPAGITVLDELVRKKVKLSGINIMAMNYNRVSKDMGRQAMSAADASVEQLAELYPKDDRAQIWKTLTITVMAGHNNTPSEIFTLDNAAKVREFAEEKGVGTLSLWSIGRDAPCADPATPQPSVICSGVAQEPFAFTKALTISAR